MGTKYVQSQTSRLSRDLTLPYPTRSKMPKLVYGTAWKKEKTADLVYAALKTGFRAVDTAAQPKHYNEEGVAAGVKRAVDEGIVKRQDLFVRCSKTHPDVHRYSHFPFTTNINTQRGPFPNKPSSRSKPSLLRPLARTT